MGRRRLDDSSSCARAAALSLSTAMRLLQTCRRIRLEASPLSDVTKHANDSGDLVQLSRTAYCLLYHSTCLAVLRTAFVLRYACLDGVTSRRYALCPWAFELLPTAK